ncbi:M4 family metallopeptidase [Streptomyces apocyni]|uniref:M4 family metallopeptidase n=1 Tax=Streptomyces apocyni TaxID=2654677 RepID=UPI0012EAE905|nr:M4 family metallopeptidase [Streptomyces apocyni]
MRSLSGRRTSHTRAKATGALIAATALLAVGIQTSVAGASTPQAAAPAAADKGADPGALPAKLSPAQRTALIREADASKAETAKELGLGKKEKLVVRDVVQDRDGTTHTRYERTYGGLPVLGGDLIVSQDKSGEAESVSKASTAKLKGIATSAKIAASTAEKQALGAAKAEGAKKPAAEQAPRKVVWMADGEPTLAYETVVGGLQKDGTPNELHVVTDAASGAKLYEWQAVHNGDGHTQYSGDVELGTARSGSNYTLSDTNRGNHRTYNLNRGTSGQGTLFSGPDDVWGNGTPQNLETAGADAHYGAALTWDYYKSAFGRDGIRGDGVGAYSRVHYGNNYVNAFWQDSCFCMTYGDGDGNAKPLTSIDVAAHEMTHGLTSSTAGLRYSGESGGLNEATSDIMAAAVEFAANNSKDLGDYLVGEKIDIRGNGTPLRYMDKPSRDGNSKDYWYSGIGNVDVHYSSGPANHFFYLLSEGSGKKTVNGVDYDSPTSDGLPVTGIGREKAALIWYKALSTKWGTTTNYAGARTGTLEVTADLYGGDSDEYKAVQHAWAGVNVGERPDDGGPGEPGDTYENGTDVQIPDYGSAVTSSITVDRDGNAPSALKVGVDIEHTWRGDLVIDLIAPDGTAYRLKNASGGDSADDVKETYTVNASSETAAGTWKLRVQDVARWDTGYINSWKLTF